MKNTCPYNDKIICAYIFPEDIEARTFHCSHCEHYRYQDETPESVKLETKSVLKAGALIFSILIGGLLALWGLKELILSLRP